jgi:hypothetical protein
VICTGLKVWPVTFITSTSPTGIGNGTFRLVDLYNNVLISTNLNADTDTFALPRTGTYVLVLEGRRDSGSGSSNYSLIVQPVAPSVVTPLTIGSTVNGTIAITGESDLFSFTLAQTTRVHFDSLTDSGSMTWTLTGPSGTLVNHRPFNSSDSFDFGAPLMSLGPGTYTLMVDANDDVIGNYGFRLLDAAAAVVITPGTSVNGSLSPATESDLYRFEGVAGDLYYINITTGIGNGTFRLVDLYNNVLISTNLNSDTDTFALPRTGTYVLVLEGRRDSGSRFVELQPDRSTGGTVCGDTPDDRIHGQRNDSDHGRKRSVQLHAGADDASAL